MSGALKTMAQRLRGQTLIALTLALLLAAPASAAAGEYALETSTASISTARAGGHPDFETVVKFTQESEAPFAPFGRTKDLSFELPPGMVGNPNSVVQCAARQLPPDFLHQLASCPQDSQVGVTRIDVAGEASTLVTPIYNLMPPASGDVVARFGFNAIFFPVFIDVHLRAGSDYGLTATITSPPSQLPLIKADTTIWGLPGSQSHDSERFSYAEGFFCAGPCGAGKPSGLVPPARPFLSNPAGCGPLAVGIAADSYLEPARVIRATAPLPSTVECERVGFQPSMRVTATNPTAGEPTGLEAVLQIPQDENPDSVSTSPLREASVTLPQGMTINPPAADGLAACSAAQVGYGTAAPSGCPQAAKIGSATLISPSLSGPLAGAIYQRTPEPGHIFRLWLVTDDLGVHLKLPGEVEADPSTGQLTATFVDTPPLPAEEIKLDFKGGARGLLRNPDSCGVHRSAYRLTPWSGNPPSEGIGQMTIDRGCSAHGFDPGFEAGAGNPVAGSYSPFLADVTREDGETNVSGIKVVLPEGELAKLAGVPLCEGATAAIGACPKASRIGSASVEVGSGTLPLHIPQPGKDATAVYLGGPYEGAPYSLVIVVPAQAGPFDLGTVVTRAGIHIDPETARVTVESDPVPQILEGVPIEYRRIHVAIDRSRFSLNPTSCEAMSVGSAIVSVSGQPATRRSPFEVGSCADLAFEPRLYTRLFGPTRRTGHPKLRAVLKMPPGGANIERAAVTMPRSEFLDQGHIGTICTRVQFSAGGEPGEKCPRGSVYGYAKAFTPLLDRPLRGPVYLRSSGHELPDLVAALHGPLDIVLDGRIDSVHGGIRAVFQSVPDAPVSTFVLAMAGGKKGLLVNSRDICTGNYRAIARFHAHNGRFQATRPMLSNARCPRSRRH